MNLLQLCAYFDLNYSNNYNSFETWLVSCLMHVVSEGTRFVKLQAMFSSAEIFSMLRISVSQSSCTLEFCSVTNSGVTETQANHCDSRMPLHPVMS